MLDKFLAEVTKRQRVIEDSVFRSPPANMEDFQLRLGRWLELEETSQWLSKLLKDLDTQEDTDT